MISFLPFFCPFAREAKSQEASNTSLSSLAVRFIISEVRIKLGLRAVYATPNSEYIKFLSNLFAML